MNCILCEKPLVNGYGNNPWPVKPVTAGQCCDHCNKNIVNLARWELWKCESAASAPYAANSLESQS